MSENSQPGDVFENLRRFMRPRDGHGGRRTESAERCGLCGAFVGQAHHHLLDLKSRKVVCGCEPCTILFSDRAAGGYRRIPTDIQSLPDFTLSDEQWEELSVPINMAFFCRSDGATESEVFYPSPAGATQAHIDLHSWRQLVEQNTALQRMETDVEALLVNRVTHPHEYYIVPIDECYRLVGLIRTQWRGFSGGKDVWKAIGEFFTSLKSRARSARWAVHA
jgi:hypothetical protein